MNHENLASIAFRNVPNPPGEIDHCEFILVTQDFAIHHKCFILNQNGRDNAITLVDNLLATHQNEMVKTKLLGIVELITQ